MSLKSDSRHPSSLLPALARTFAAERWRSALTEAALPYPLARQYIRNRLECQLICVETRAEAPDLEP
jgi:P2-related tail formation protein